ncbi:ABC transporter ATP-binding protein [Sinomonas mesophila]|uniref:ABC transporter ATP-binding protein n=1 Tax=Sinomonas mesophila TaxID=1531955 RepID=UPI00098712D4|nr:ABC transporter ATP-binding protein [Sinomonas mesophila]
MKSTEETTPILAAEGLSLGFDGRTVVHSLDLAFERGTVTTVIGPNGCGKSTLLRGLGRLLRPEAGRVTLDGAQIAAMPPRAVACRLSVLPQTPQAPAGLTVGELVARGRHPRQRWYQQFTGGDERAVSDALAATDISDLAGVPLEDLSGGQRQRAWISMTLAQETELLLLDEPTTYLDLAHQVEVLELVQRLNRELGRTVVMVLHDISLAARYSDRIVAMRDGRIVASGTPGEVITPRLLWDVFGLKAQVIAEPTDGRPHVVPIGGCRVVRAVS